MRIINVIYFNAGVLNYLYSFPILEDTMNKEAQDAIIRKAECFFIDKIYTIWPAKRFSIKEEESFIEDGRFEYGKHEILLTWSDVKL